VLRTRVNSQIVQESSLRGMVFSMAYVIADLTRMMTLVPGDVIFTGMPANSRPVEPGDVVTVECDGLGMLENRISEGSWPHKALLPRLPAPPGQGRTEDLGKYFFDGSSACV
jgi:5-oxopent-3-ene-1,2,5-tricarboxylate decarboxylase/2-hydroxyhepta-2,4-diene-1,7-dioate isomerase